MQPFFASVAAAVFFRSGNHGITKQSAMRTSPERQLWESQLRLPCSRSIALLASGQNSTLTGTLAGQVVLEGFMHVKIKPWMRRMISRLIALVPTIFVVALSGENGVENLMLWSQVVLSAQLSFAVVPPPIQFTSMTEGRWARSRKRLGHARNTGGPRLLVIAALNQCHPHLDFAVSGKARPVLPVASLAGDAHMLLFRRILLLGAIAALAAFAACQPVPSKLYDGMRWRMIGPFRGGRTVGAAGVPSQPGVF